MKYQKNNHILMWTKLMWMINLMNWTYNKYDKFLWFELNHQIKFKF